MDGRWRSGAVDAYQSQFFIAVVVEDTTSPEPRCPLPAWFSHHSRLKWWTCQSWFRFEYQSARSVYDIILLGVEVVLLGMLGVETYGYSWCTHLMYCCVTVSNSLISQLRLIDSTKPKRGRGLGKFGIPSWLYPRVLLDSYHNHWMISHSREYYGFRHTASISHQYSGSPYIPQPDIPCTPAQTSPRLSDTPQSEVRQMGSLIPLELGRLIISPIFLTDRSRSG